MPTSHFTLLRALFWTAFGCAVAARADIASDYAAITSGVTSINAGTGTPGDCAIFG
ncbi:MAG TPA: hypothetical protein VD994_08115 [Prosthecobacter sp.]|nr:hypothetical protein [Prosthecobacter sp.]